MTIQLESIGLVRGGRTEVVDDNWGDVKARIELDTTRFSSESLAGLESFSDVTVVYYFHRSDPLKIELGARHPRNNPAWPKIGILRNGVKIVPTCLAFPPAGYWASRAPR